MARFCTKCGKEISQEMEFCTECGTKAPIDSETKATEAAPPKVEPPVVQTQPQTQQITYQQPQQTYTQPAPQPTYQQSAPAVDPTNKMVRTGTYFGLMLLFAIPIIGFIACIIMAFAPKNKNIKHFARAVMIWMIIGLVVSGLLIALLSVLTNSLMSYIEQAPDGQFGEFGETFSQFSEFGETMNEFGNLTEQFEGGEFNDLPLE